MNLEQVAEANGMLDERRLAADMYKPTKMQIKADAQLIAGFKEALKQLKVGEKAYFYMPSHLAYGERGRGGIPANSDLTFILEMIEIVK